MASGTRMAAAARASREMAALVEANRPKTRAEQAPKPRKGKGARKPAEPVK
jgi:hypothetical protein